MLGRLEQAWQPIGPLPSPFDVCAFETDRLLADEWHSRPREEGELARIVADILSEPVTRSLPTSWQGSYTVERARVWVEERNNEGTALLVVEKSTGEPIGLMFLFEEGVPGRTEVRIGYLLSESAWGKGLATELVGAFVGWCRQHVAVQSVTGGVERGNVASIRVLEKNGFRAVADNGDTQHDDQLFRLSLRQ